MNWKRKNILTPLILLLLATGLTGCAFLSIGNSASWKEEVLLHDGRVVIVERSVERGGRHEIGQKGPYREQSLAFTMPDTNKTITWEDHFSQELGMANFLPMLLDVHDAVAYLVVNPMGCLSYNKWGRPNPPYVIFKYVGDQWQRVSLQELPGEIKTPNMISSMPDIELERAKTSYMTKEMIARIVSTHRSPEYQTILRKPLDKERCPQYPNSPKAPIPIL